MTSLTEEQLAGLRVGGKYVVDRVIGKGGMGCVALGLHEQLKKRVAIKFLLNAVSEEVVSRFLREAQMACTLQSEHVVHVFDVGRTDDGTPYMVMEYLEGSSLGERLEAGGAVSIGEAAFFVTQALEAVQEAHEAGIVHRDLKPDNLFLAKKGGSARTIKVLDFGISKSSGKGEDSHSLTQTTTVLGSPAYMSPEQIHDARSVTPRSDIWSLGVVLYELVEGDAPFQAPSIGGLFGMIQYVDPPPMKRATREFEAVVRKCLAREPAHRYASATELMLALKPFVGNAPTLSLHSIPSPRSAQAETIAAASTVVAPSSGPVSVEALEAQVQARTAERSGAVEEIGRLDPVIAEIERRLALSRRKVAEVTQRATGVRGERAAAEERFNRQVGTRSQGVEEARKHVRAAMVQFGRSAILDTAVYGEEFSPARDEVSRAEAAAARLQREVLVHEAALGADDTKRVRQGIAIVAAAALVLLLLLFFPFIRSAIEN